MSPAAETPVPADEPEEEAEPLEEEGLGEDEIYETKWLAEGRTPDDPALVVTLAHGPIEKNYAPVDVVAKVAERIGVLLHDLGGGFVPMLYGAVPGSSMKLFFGDPSPAAMQTTLPVEFTLPQAKRVAELIDQDDDELYARALQMGEPALRYVELAQTVHSEGVTLLWEPRGEAPHELDPVRAARHQARLTAEVPMRDQELKINGILYRVIAEPRDGNLGTVGIHLHSWSARPPGRSRRTVIAAYTSDLVAQQIKDGLIGESVEALLVIRAPLPGMSLNPDQVTFILASIEPGPGETSRLGTPMISEE